MKKKAWYEPDRIGRTTIGRARVSTVCTFSGTIETCIFDGPTPELNRVVEAYKTKAAARRGHLKWCRRVRKAKEKRT